MGELPDYVLFRDREIPPRFSTHPHRLALLPDGLALEQLGTVAHVSACYLVDAGCSHDTLNERAFASYLQQFVPILIHCQFARDLRPFKKRSSSFAARGYAMVVVP
jgi:hypothetical protein